LQGLLSLGALIQATVILITMVDELRLAHPDLEGSTDPQIEALKKTVDPHRSLETLNQLLDEEQAQE
jgi:hypothetical protein